MNDGSTDGTEQALKNFTVLKIKHAKNKGYSNTLNTAFEYANNALYDFICYFDADGEHKSEDLDKFKFEVNEHCLAKVGVRSSFNRIGERFAAKYGAARFGIRDPYCGLKSYNLRQLRNMSFNSWPGCKIGTGLVREIVKYYGDSSVQNVSISVAKRKDFSRFSANFLSANFNLIKNILT